MVECPTQSLIMKYYLVRSDVTLKNLKIHLSSSINIFIE